MERLAIAGARRPHNRRGCLLSCGAALAFLVQCVAQSTNDESAHRSGITKANFRLGRMYVDVDLVEGHFEEQGRYRMPIARYQVPIGRAQRADEQSVLHRS